MVVFYVKVYIQGPVPWVRWMSHKQLETEHFAEFSFWYHYYRVWVLCFLLTNAVIARTTVSVSTPCYWYVWCHPIILLSSSGFCPVLPLFWAYFLSSSHAQIFSINFMFSPHFSPLLKHKLSFTRANSVNIWLLLNHSLISCPQTSLEQPFPIAHQHIMTAKEGTQRETNCNSTCPAWHQTRVMSFHNHRTYCVAVLIFPSHRYWTSNFTKNGYLMATIQAGESELVALEAVIWFHPGQPESQRQRTWHDTGPDKQKT